MGPYSPSLRAAGLRKTLPREAILDALQQADRPLTVEEIRERMDERRSGLPTIYRNLECFVARGWVESIMGEDQVMRFVRCRTGHHHHHLQCERCGRVVEVEGCGLEGSLAAMERQSGFTITRHKLMLFGICFRCGQEKDG